jgi:DNA-directed RNA polymerase specialized sigma24 family protein
LIHLKGVVKSLISSHIKSSTRAAAVVRKASGTVAVEEAEDLGAAMDAEDTDDPEQILISDENWKRLETAFGEDMEGFLIFYDWLDGKPPREIAAAYNCDNTHIYNIIKRGKRLLQKILLD